MCCSEVGKATDIKWQHQKEKQIREEKTEQSKQKKKFVQEKHNREGES